ncbi:MAG: SDR family NAD(P)-dependent oxidoreductase [Bacteroidota bacterium]
MQEQRFTGKVAIITGAAIGIGYEIAAALAKEGAAVILNDLDEKLANEAAKKIQSTGGECIPIAGDASDLDTIKVMIEAAKGQFGSVDLLIANAGITTFGSFLEYAPDDFQRLIEVNLKGTFFLAQAAAKDMIAQEKGGRILLMSSVTGHQAHPDLTAYGMTKAAIRMLAKSLGVELGKYGITVNAISPGATLTERTLNLEGDYMSEWESITPTGKAARTEDIAHAALFLLSPPAHHITGQTLVVDGGWTSYSPPPH